MVGGQRFVTSAEASVSLLWPPAELFRKSYVRVARVRVVARFCPPATVSLMSLGQNAIEGCEASGDVNADNGIRELLNGSVHFEASAAARLSDRRKRDCGAAFGRGIEGTT